MDQAAEIFTMIIRTAPYGKYTARAQFDLGRAREKQGRNEAAIAAYEAVVEKFPDDPIAVDAQYQIGYIWSKASTSGTYDPAAANHAKIAYEDFLARYPNIRLILHATNRRVDVLNEGFDVALRVRTTPTGEDGLVMRTFGEGRHLLVASGAYLEQRGRPELPEQLAQHATLSFALETDRQTWDLLDSNGVAARVEHSPRLVCHDFPLLRAAVLAGLGVALLPESVVRPDIESGRLEQVLPAWTLPLGVFHVVFPTRRGLLPSVRAFIDFLAERMPGEV